MIELVAGWIKFLQKPQLKKISSPFDGSDNPKRDKNDSPLVIGLEFAAA